MANTEVEVEDEEDEEASDGASFGIVAVVGVWRAAIAAMAASRGR